MKTPYILLNSPLYALRAADGKCATNDMRSGPSLTSNPNLCYSWRTKEEAESARQNFERVLAVALTVEVLSS